MVGNAIYLTDAALIAAPVLLITLIFYIIPRAQEWKVKHCLLVIVGIAFPTYLLVKLCMPLFQDSILGIGFLIVFIFLINMTLAVIFYDLRWGKEFKDSPLGESGEKIEFEYKILQWVHDYFMRVE